MKKKALQLTALVLIIVLAMPAVAFADHPAENLPQRIENGTVFVPMRDAAYAHGAGVGWDEADQSAWITFAAGDTWTFDLGEFLFMTGGFVERGVTWVPVEVVYFIFSDAFTIPAPLTTFTFALTEQARDIALADFDYLIDFIVGNTPWDSVITRGLGFGFAEHAALHRGFIESMEPLTLVVADADEIRTVFPIQEGECARSLAANYLFLLLANSFAPPLMGVGHLGPRTLDIYTAQITGFAREYHKQIRDGEYNYFLSALLDAFAHPSAVWFYGEVEIDLHAEDHPMPAIPDNVAAIILEPGEVAYLRISSFMSDPDYDDLVILPFLQKIKDYNHLIIDLRNNWGGLMSYFPNLIMKRLINEPLEIGDFEFFSGGDAAVALMDALIKTALRQLGDAVGYSEILYAEVLPAQAFIDGRGKGYFDPDDLAGLDHVVVSRSRMHPDDDAVGFSGRVWLLVDGFSASSSAAAAYMSLDTGFATVVGENTSGIMGSTHMYIALPQTGIIWRADIGYRTDGDGNSLEIYGIAPDIRNLPGMDALETTLTVIAGFKQGLGEMD
jgi:hypothetical protein